MTNQLITWYKKNKRDLPWRNTRDPYKIWVSEIIMQQTQIKTGTKYYIKFIDKFPDIDSLAMASELEVLHTWQGLGYYNRALNMLNAAKTIKNNFSGIFPSSYNELITLKGVGIYTASAISSICQNEKRAVVDGNVYRVLSRFYNIATPINTNDGKKLFQKIANTLIHDSIPGIYNQAIMDFGAIHCKKNNPKCNTCPLKINCAALKLNLINYRPVKKPPKKIRTRYFNYLLIKFDGCIVIQQRDKNDIWKKLYELPLIESKEMIDKKHIITHNYLDKFKIYKIQNNGRKKHMLSHQKLVMSFWEIIIKEWPKKQIYKKIKLTEISNYPFPKPLKEYLNKEDKIH